MLEMMMHLLHFVLSFDEAAKVTIEPVWLPVCLLEYQVRSGVLLLDEWGL